MSLESGSCETRAQAATRALGGRWSGRSGSAKCPCHDDRKASLSLSDGDNGQLLWHCHAGCSQTDVFAALAALGIIGAGSGGPNADAPEHVAPYTDERGALLFEVLRWRIADGSKRVQMRRPRPSGGWVYSLDDTRKVLYHLPEVVQAAQVFVVEGEAKADKLRAALAAAGAQGVAVTCNPGGAGKWRDSYGAQLAGKDVAILTDNDEPGRSHGKQVAASVARAHRGAESQSHVRLIELPGLAEKEDVADWLDAGHTVVELLELVRKANEWELPPCAAMPTTPWSAATVVPAEEEGGDTTEEIEPGLLYRESITRISSPRGLGKSEWATALVVSLARAGRRVLYLDRDNPPRASRNRIRQWGGAENPNLRHLPRNKIPNLFDANWASFPAADYDVVVIDSLESFMEGAGEQDSTKPSLALARLLDIAHAEGGPAILALSNTTRDGKRGRGSGVTEDRMDFIFEVRDATGFKPSGAKPWHEELPPADANSWAARASRRKERKDLRLAFVCSKFRFDSEPQPFVREIDFSGDAPISRDVTADVDAAGEADRQSRLETKATARAAAVEALRLEIARREAASEPEMTWSSAERHLTAAGHKRPDARAALEDGLFEQVSTPGRGGPKVIRRRGINRDDGAKESAGKPLKIEGEADGDLRRPHRLSSAQNDAHKPQDSWPLPEALNCAERPANTPSQGRLVDLLDEGPEPATEDVIL